MQFVSDGDSAGIGDLRIDFVLFPRQPGSLQTGADPNDNTKTVQSRTDKYTKQVTQTYVIKWTVTSITPV